MSDTKYITLSNLSYYDGKIKEYVSSEISKVNTSIGSIKSFSTAIVQTLPTENISSTTIYLKPATVADSENNDTYDEYLYVNGAWEKIGNTKISMTGYYTKEEVDSAVSTAVSSYVPFEAVETLPTANISTKKIYFLTVETGTYQKGSYIYFDGSWIMVSTAVTPATSSEVDSGSASSSSESSSSSSESSSTEETVKTPATLTLTYNVGDTLVAIDVSGLSTLTDADTDEAAAKAGTLVLQYLGNKNNDYTANPIVIPYADTDAVSTFTKPTETGTVTFGTANPYWVFDDDKLIHIYNMNVVQNNTQFKLVDNR